MTFEEWLEETFSPYKEMIDLKSQEHILKTGNLRKAWNEAVNQAQLIAWEHAREIRKATHTCTRCDDVAEDIRKLEAVTAI